MLKKYVNKDSSLEHYLGLIKPTSSPDVEKETTESLIDPDIQMNYDSEMLSSQRLHN